MRYIKPVYRCNAVNYYDVSCHVRVCKLYDRKCSTLSMLIDELYAAVASAPLEFGDVHKHRS